MLSKIIIPPQNNSPSNLLSIPSPSADPKTLGLIWDTNRENIITQTKSWYCVYEVPNQKILSPSCAIHQLIHDSQNVPLRSNSLIGSTVSGRNTGVENRGPFASKIYATGLNNQSGGVVFSTGNCRMGMTRNEAAWPHKAFTNQRIGSAKTDRMTTFGEWYCMMRCPRCFL